MSSAHAAPRKLVTLLLGLSLLAIIVGIPLSIIAHDSFYCVGANPGISDFERIAPYLLVYLAIIFSLASIVMALIRKRAKTIVLSVIWLLLVGLSYVIIHTLLSPLGCGG